MSVEASASPATAFRRVTGFFRSSVGAKVLMALTGLFLWGFAIQHVLMNLQALLPAPEGGFAGQQLNEYAIGLKSTAWIVWPGRVGLLVAFLAHAFFGIRLARANRAARAQRYGAWQPRASTLASRYMALSGVLVLGFLIFHLAHFTFGWVDPAFLTFQDRAGQHDVYRMMREGFRSLPVVLFYVVLMAVFFLHLFHGSVSLFQSLGARSRAWTPVVTVVARALVLLLIVGFAAIPSVIWVSWQLAR